MAIVNSPRRSAVNGISFTPEVEPDEGTSRSTAVRVSTWFSPAPHDEPSATSRRTKRSDPLPGNRRPTGCCRIRAHDRKECPHSDEARQQDAFLRDLRGSQGATESRPRWKLVAPHTALTAAEPMFTLQPSSRDGRAMRPPAAVRFASSIRARHTSSSPRTKPGFRARKNTRCADPAGVLPEAQ